MYVCFGWTHTCPIIKQPGLVGKLIKLGNIYQALAYLVPFEMILWCLVRVNHKST